MNLERRFNDARAKLQAAGQIHLFEGFEKLDEHAASRLLSEIESINWDQLTELIESHVKQKPDGALPGHLEPAPWYPHHPTPDLAARYKRARVLGEQLVRGGKVAAFTVAGGQGTRLGWDGPKGTYGATPIRGLPLFAFLAEFILKTQEKYGTPVPWYLMTSPANDAATRAFFEDHDYFGLDRGNVMLFPQAMMPAIDLATGKVLLAAPGRLSLSPDGHGGSLKALHASGAIADMQERGIEQISYTQIDNPLVRVVDPLFIGLHALDGAQMSSKMLTKANAHERVGNFCQVDGKVIVVEYSDLPYDLTEQRDESGALRFRAGSTAIHLIRVDFVASLNRSAGGFALPFHRAEKTVAHLDPRTAKLVDPDRPNAVKLEMFVFDALPLCDVSIVYETDRTEEFAPIKNFDDPDPARCIDSPTTSQRLQIERAARWLESRGVKVPRDPDGRVDAVLEISQRAAIEPADLDGLDLPTQVDPGARFLLEPSTFQHS